MFSIFQTVAVDKLGSAILHSFCQIAAIAIVLIFSPVLAGEAPAAESKDDSPGLPARYRIEIEGGQWIEFAAVQRKDASEREPAAWLPDGRKRNAPVKHNFTFSGEIEDDHFVRTFAFTASVDDGVSLSLKADGGFAGGVFRDNEDGVTRATIVRAAKYEDGSQSANVRLKVAAGPWKTVATAGGAGGVQNGVEFRPQVFRGEKPGPLTAIFPAEFSELPDVRIIAVDRNGKFYHPQSFSTGGKPNGTQLKAEFDEDMSGPTYHVQQRDYATLEFTGVSLHPDEPRPVAIKLNGRPIDPKEPLPVESLFARAAPALRVPLDDAGSYVELKGITAYPDPSGWWSADGSEVSLDRKPTLHEQARANDNDKRQLEMVWVGRLSASAASDEWLRVDDDLSSRGSRHSSRKLPDGAVEFEHVVIGAVYEHLNSIGATVRAAWGDWQRMAELSVKDQAWREEHQHQAAGQPYVVVRRARENEEGKTAYTSINVVFEEDPAFNYQVVLEEKTGERHPALLTSGRENDRVAIFRIGPAKTKAFYLERRPVRTARVANISLFKGVPTRPFGVPPVEALPPALSPDVEPKPARVLRTYLGDIITLPDEPVLEQRLAELQRRGALLKFEPADKSLIEELRRRNRSRDPDGPVPHVIQVEKTQELAFLGWRDDVPGRELHLLRNIVGLNHLSLKTTAQADQMRMLNTLSDLREIYLTAWEAGPELFASLGELREIERLRLDVNFRIGENGAQADHLRPLRNLKRLRYLSAANLSFTDGLLAHLADLTNLESLWAGNCETVTDRGLAHLAGLRKLEYLVLHRIMATDAGLKRLSSPRLEYLDIPSDRYTDASMSHLMGMPKLRRLDLSGSQVTDAGMAILASAPSLEKLDLRDTRVTQAGVDVVKSVRPDLELQWNGRRPTVGAKPAKGIALRIVPVLGEEAAPMTLTQPHVAALTTELKDDGPQAGRRRNQHFQWFRLSNERFDIPIAQRHADQQYGLLPAQSDWIMRAYIVRPQLIKATAQKSTAPDVWEIAIEVKNAAEILAALTERFRGRQLAITIDDAVLAAPTIRSRVESSLVISGGWSHEEAEAIALQLARAAGLDSLPPAEDDAPAPE